MEPSTAHQPGTGLSYENPLPIRYRKVGAPPEAAELSQLQESNTELLRVIAALDEHAPELGEEDPAVAHELQRLDFKLNVLLRLVGHLFTQQSMVPAPVAARLSPGGVEWQCAPAPQVGDIVRLEIFLNMQYPQPLVVYGEIVEVVEKNSATHASAQFQGLGEITQDWLEKIIFRHHRRHIAHQRRG